MLPRPARLIHQQKTLLCRTSRKFTSTSIVHPQGQVVHHIPSTSIDESFNDLIREDDMGMGMGPSRSIKPGKSKGKGRMHDLEVVDHDHSSPSGNLDFHKFGVIQHEPPSHQYRLGDDEGEGEYLHERREERRSPAAVLGSKRIGVVVLPEALKNGIQRQIDLLDNPRTLRQSYLDLPSSPSQKTREEKVDHRSSKPRKTVESELAKAAGILPGEYGVIRNILEEMDRRLGTGWLERVTQEGEITEVVEFSGGLGAGLWATVETLKDTSSAENLRIQLVHSSRHGLDLAKKITEDIPEQAAEILYNRKHHSYPSPPALALSTFLLSTLPTQPSQQSHLLQLLSLNSPYIILVDRSTPAGWQAISHARSFLLDQSTPENPLHVIAPCPHDGVCPLASTDDKCSFSQRLQRPSFVRKTKHSSRGEEDTGYCYVVLARGERPVSGLSDEVQLQGMLKSALGRMGGVGKEEAEKARLKKAGRSVLREIEGHEGILEVVNLPEYDGSHHQHVPASSNAADKEDLQKVLTNEAYSWPRLVAPPMKRSGHVTMDACCPDGNIQRLTFSKSHSKQGYHDARKSSWGDIFPHTPKATPVVRTRGVRRLSKPVNDDQVLHDLTAALREEGSELDNSVLEDDLVELEKLGINIPRAEVVQEAEGDYPVSGNKSNSGENGPFGSAGQRRHFASMSVRRPIVQAVGLSPSLQSRHMSARPPPRAKVTLSTLEKLSMAKTPITVLTAYDFPTALLSESCGVDMTLVGDSLSQVCLGHTSTTEITLDEIIHHAKAVTKGAKTPFVFADLPFGSFEVSLEDGVRNVIRLVKESGIDGVKIEGGLEIIPLVKRLSEIGIPVMPHLGLQPQRATYLSGYLVQGRTSQSAYEICNTAKAMQDAGAFAVLLEAIPDKVARRITEDLDIITIGIGAGNGTNGQVLVITDVLGTYAEEPQEEIDIVEPATQLALNDVSIPSTPSVASDLTTTTSATNVNGAPEKGGDDIAMLEPPKKSLNSPKFVRHFGNIGELSRRVIKSYLKAVREGDFPNASESYGMKKDQWEGFLRLLEGNK
uniref:3-methyl-2-oxobutanoate hydroxymethyltransferase n=1 Tax=Kwoniella bestiolae CBS 10118 TaxID=1296100 RepID=A0A1B9G522_9TREE|nr:3-methyl-2-oxobutanoate hydroxymethyltransferase [Kwoniella bestiolae CBS 10118]OCF26134.1 3-methyl-2-oxobutanoate hydroxymethyltransferase [Kwoniella bestiolae CBS 10118]